MSANASPANVTEMIVFPDDSSLSQPVKGPTERFPWLKCTITLDLAVVGFTIRGLLELRIGTVVETSCKATSDVPVRVNGTLIGWTEFEVIGNTLAVRITELA
jgi:flagellar motor switch/type III secretory pathway protein FliN